MKKTNNNSQTILLYQAIMQSNMHPTTKSFLGQVLKNMPMTNERLTQGLPQANVMVPNRPPATEPFNILDPEEDSLAWADEEDATMMEGAKRFQQNLGGLGGNQDWTKDEDYLAELSQNR